MDSEQSSMNAQTMAMIQGALGNSLAPGEMGILLARAGVGKTACLTHIALEQLLRGTPVLHVAIDEVPEKIKVWYHELLKNLVAAQPDTDLATLQQQIEPMRFILAYLHQTFSPEKLEQSYQNLQEEAKFNAGMVIVDGLDFDQVSRSTLEALQKFAQQHQVALWMSARTHRHMAAANDRGIPYPCHEMDDLFHTIILLEPIPKVIQLKVLKHVDGSREEPASVFLNPQTYLLEKS